MSDPSAAPAAGLGPIIMRLLRDGFREQGRLYGVAIAAMVVVAGSAAAVAWVMEWIIDALGNPENRGAVIAVASTVIAIFVIKGAATYTQSVFMARAGNRIVASYQYRVYSKLVSQGVGYFNRTESSDIIMRVVQGATACRTLIDIIVVSAVRDTLTLVGLIGVMIYQQPTLSLVSLLVGPVALWGIRIILRRVKSIMESQLTAFSEIYRVLQESSGGIHVIKVFSLEDHMRGRMDGAVRRVEDRMNSISRLESATSPIIETLAGFAIAGVILVSAWNVLGGQPSTPGELMSFVTALMMAYEPAKRLSRMRVSIETALVGVRMVLGILDMPESQAEARDARPLKPGRGALEMRGVTFGYGAAPVVRNLDLLFSAGQTSALVGPSGGGKSTILNLAMRLYEPSEGEVLIDGQDLAGATLSSVRQRISFVGQNTFLFSTSVRENIRMARSDATDAEVEAAAQDANAHTFVSELPQGYETMVGENGSFLSGGQRQRLAIARAILKRSDIMLFDEATSALDSHSEALIQEALARVTRDKTTVVIAHRLSTILGADQIIYVEEGRVVERGTLRDLLAADGPFRRLYDRQFGVAEPAPIALAEAAE
ncbi:ATP-binding cassette subfamily B protein [Hasllibacter halocynthiae]|uniref:ATP-binding cassette subfamily B protein n=1 Tax=Hasllibacter halocynthiae TaxID=595589 RepID=A0A2T0X1J6_9RHOB|nr:ABC transporter ATP-binding protein [Hasllibacter halocynthiae]PRY92811.1 ATP-binding cassette subfamily B protein [Hasllibacter halocynthiae]